jgi:hypothetical protein
LMEELLVSLACMIHGKVRHFNLPLFDLVLVALYFK